MPKISLRLNSQSIGAAIRQTEDYRNSLDFKAERIRKEVMAQLSVLVRNGFNGAFYDGLLYEGWQVPSVEVTTDPEAGEHLSLVIAHGKEAVFIEFGAGVYYNPSGAPHPNRKNGILAIGEYGKGYGKRQVWGYYDESGDLHLTHGTPASMPMFYAVKEIAERVPQIARDVFKESGG